MQLSSKPSALEAELALGVPLVNRGASFQLEFLFRAQLMNGEIIRQTPEDRCPTDSRRSAYWDLLRKDFAGQGIAGPDGYFLARPDIRWFLIEGRGEGYGVNLETGRFAVLQNGAYAGIDAINGVDLLKPGLFPLTLIYFRRMRQHMEQSGKLIGRECEYHFGWRDSSVGSPVSQTLVVAQ